MKNYYKILDVDRYATDQEIRTAYKKGAVKLHPDKNSGNPKAGELFKELGEAYKVLTNASQDMPKATYDIDYDFYILLNNNFDPTYEEESFSPDMLASQPPLLESKFVYIFTYPAILAFAAEIQAVDESGILYTQTTIDLFKSFVREAVQQGHRIAIINGNVNTNIFKSIQERLSIIFQDTPQIIPGIIIHLSEGENYMATSVANICNALKSDKYVFIDTSFENVNAFLTGYKLAWFLNPVNTDLQHDLINRLIYSLQNPAVLTNTIPAYFSYFELPHLGNTDIKITAANFNSTILPFLSQLSNKDKAIFLSKLLQNPSHIAPENIIKAFLDDKELIKAICINEKVGKEFFYNRECSDQKELRGRDFFRNLTRTTFDKKNKKSEEAENSKSFIRFIRFINICKEVINQYNLSPSSVFFNIELFNVLSSYSYKNCVLALARSEQEKIKLLEELITQFFSMPTDMYARNMVYLLENERGILQQILPDLDIQALTKSLTSPTVFFLKPIPSSVDTNKIYSMTSLLTDFLQIYYSVSVQTPGAVNSYLLLEAVFGNIVAFDRYDFVTPGLLKTILSILLKNNLKFTNDTVIEKINYLLQKGVNCDCDFTQLSQTILYDSLFLGDCSIIQAIISKNKMEASHYKRIIEELITKKPKEILWNYKNKCDALLNFIKAMDADISKQLSGELHQLQYRPFITEDFRAQLIIVLNQNNILLPQQPPAQQLQEGIEKGNLALVKEALTHEDLVITKEMLIAAIHQAEILNELLLKAPRDICTPDLIEYAVGLHSADSLSRETVINSLEVLFYYHNMFRLNDPESKLIVNLYNKNQTEGFKNTHALDFLLSLGINVVAVPQNKKFNADSKKTIQGIQDNLKSQQELNHSSDNTSDDVRLIEAIEKNVSSIVEEKLLLENIKNQLCDKTNPLGSLALSVALGNKRFFMLSQLLKMGAGVHFEGPMGFALAAIICKRPIDVRDLETVCVILNRNKIDIARIVNDPLFKASKGKDVLSFLSNDIWTNQKPILHKAAMKRSIDSSNNVNTSSIGLFNNNNDANNNGVGSGKGLPDKKRQRSEQK